MKGKKPRVLVGMSGGVDSSVAAALLKKQGYDVIGITMQLLPEGKEKESACCNLNAISDARRVASILDIPHYTLNIREQFQSKVIDYFVDSYIAGQTPNPCVECNRHIKFDELKKKADELDAAFVATGHYCKRTSTKTPGIYNLKKGKDPAKDQSYFLYMLTSKELEHTLFPLGNYEKSKIREIATDLNLINANKADSQEICFVTSGNYKEFIEEQLNKQQITPGNIVDLDGKVLGKHQGLHRYTIGQRRGLGIASPEPIFVVDIDVKKNQVVVGKKNALTYSQLQLDEFSLVNPNEAILGKSFLIKTRYQMTPFLAKVNSVDGKKVTLELPVAQGQLSPGQSGVLYQKDRVVGGGIISR